MITSKAPVSRQDLETQLQELQGNQTFLQMRTRLEQLRRTRRQAQRKALQSSNKDMVFALEAELVGLEEARSIFDTGNYFKPDKEEALPLKY